MTRREKHRKGDDGVEMSISTQEAVATEIGPRKETNVLQSFLPVLANTPKLGVANSCAALMYSFIISPDRWARSDLDIILNEGCGIHSILSSEGSLNRLLTVEDLPEFMTFSLKAFRIQKYIFLEYDSAKSTRNYHDYLIRHFRCGMIMHGKITVAFMFCNDSYYMLDRGRKKEQYSAAKALELLEFPSMSALFQGLCNRGLDPDSCHVVQVVYFRVTPLITRIRPHSRKKPVMVTLFANTQNRRISVMPYEDNRADLDWKLIEEVRSAEIDRQSDSDSARINNEDNNATSRRKDTPLVPRNSAASCIASEGTSTVPEVLDVTKTEPSDHVRSKGGLRACRNGTSEPCSSKSSQRKNSLDSSSEFDGLQRVVSEKSKTDKPSRLATERSQVSNQVRTKSSHVVQISPDVNIKVDSEEDQIVILSSDDDDVTMETGSPQPGLFMFCESEGEEDKNEVTSQATLDSTSANQQAETEGTRKTRESDHTSLFLESEQCDSSDIVSASDNIKSESSPNLRILTVTSCAVRQHNTSPEESRLDTSAVTWDTVPPYTHVIQPTPTTDPLAITAQQQTGQDNPIIDVKNEIHIEPFVAPDVAVLGPDTGTSDVENKCRQLPSISAANPVPQGGVSTEHDIQDSSLYEAFKTLHKPASVQHPVLAHANVPSLSDSETDQHLVIARANVPSLSEAETGQRPVIARANVPSLSEAETGQHPVIARANVPSLSEAETHQKHLINVSPPVAVEALLSGNQSPRAGSVSSTKPSLPNRNLGFDSAVASKVSPGEIVPQSFKASEKVSVQRTDSLTDTSKKKDKDQEEEMHTAISASVTESGKLDLASSAPSATVHSPGAAMKEVSEEFLTSALKRKRSQQYRQSQGKERRTAVSVAVTESQELGLASSLTSSPSDDEAEHTTDNRTRGLSRKPCSDPRPHTSGSVHDIRILSEEQLRRRKQSRMIASRKLRARQRQQLDDTLTAAAELEAEQARLKAAVASFEMEKEILKTSMVAKMGPKFQVKIKKLVKQGLPHREKSSKTLRLTLSAERSLLEETLIAVTELEMEQAALKDAVELLTKEKGRLEKAMQTRESGVGLSNVLRPLMDPVGPDQGPTCKRATSSGAVTKGVQSFSELSYSCKQMTAYQSWWSDSKKVTATNKSHHIDSVEGLKSAVPEGGSAEQWRSKVPEDRGHHDQTNYSKALFLSDSLLCSIEKPQPPILERQMEVLTDSSCRMTQLSKDVAPAGDDPQPPIVVHEPTVGRDNCQGSQGLCEGMPEGIGGFPPQIVRQGSKHQLCNKMKLAWDISNRYAKKRLKCLRAKKLSNLAGKWKGKSREKDVHRQDIRDEITDIVEPIARQRENLGHSGVIMAPGVGCSHVDVAARTDGGCREVMTPGVGYSDLDGATRAGDGCREVVTPGVTCSDVDVATRAGDGCRKIMAPRAGCSDVDAATRAVDGCREVVTPGVGCSDTDAATRTVDSFGKAVVGTGITTKLSTGAPSWMCCLCKQDFDEGCVLAKNADDSYCKAGVVEVEKPTCPQGIGKIKKSLDAFVEKVEKIQGTERDSHRRCERNSTDWCHLWPHVHLPSVFIPKFSQNDKAKTKVKLRCHLCDEVFMQQTDLERHILSHSDKVFVRKKSDLFGNCRPEMECHYEYTTEEESESKEVTNVEERQKDIVIKGCDQLSQVPNGVQSGKGKSVNLDREEASCFDAEAITGEERSRGADKSSAIIEYHYDSSTEEGSQIEDVLSRGEGRQQFDSGAWSDDRGMSEERPVISGRNLSNDHGMSEERPVISERNLSKSRVVAAEKSVCSKNNSTAVGCINSSSTDSSSEMTDVLHEKCNQQFDPRATETEQLIVQRREGLGLDSISRYQDSMDDSVIMSHVLKVHKHLSQEQPRAAAEVYEASRFHDSPYKGVSPKHTEHHAQRSEQQYAKTETGHSINLERFKSEETPRYIPHCPGTRSDDKEAISTASRNVKESHQKQYPVDPDDPGTDMTISSIAKTALHQVLRNKSKGAAVRGMAEMAMRKVGDMDTVLSCSRDTRALQGEPPTRNNDAEPQRDAGLNENASTPKPGQSACCEHALENTGSESVTSFVNNPSRKSQGSYDPSDESVRCDESASANSSLDASFDLADELSTDEKVWVKAQGKLERTHGSNRESLLQECVLCSLAFENQQLLYRHLLSHLSPVCQQKYASVNPRISEKQNVNLTKEDSGDKNEENEGPSGEVHSETHSCELCNLLVGRMAKMYNNPGETASYLSLFTDTLDVFMRQQFPPPSASSIRGIVCRMCQREFDSYEALGRHAFNDHLRGCLNRVKTFEQTLTQNDSYKERTADVNKIIRDILGRWRIEHILPPVSETRLPKSPSAIEKMELMKELLIKSSDSCETRPFSTHGFQSTENYSSQTAQRMGPWNNSELRNTPGESSSANLSSRESRKTSLEATVERTTNGCIPCPSPSQEKNILYHTEISKERNVSETRAVSGAAGIPPASGVSAEMAHDSSQECITDVSENFPSISTSLLRLTKANSIVETLQKMPKITANSDEYRAKNVLEDLNTHGEKRVAIGSVRGSASASSIAVAKKEMDFCEELPPRVSENAKSPRGSANDLESTVAKNPRLGSSAQGDTKKTANEISETIFATQIDDANCISQAEDNLAGSCEAHVTSHETDDVIILCDLPSDSDVVSRKRKLDEDFQSDPDDVAILSSENSSESLPEHPGDSNDSDCTPEGRTHREIMYAHNANYCTFCQCTFMKKGSYAGHMLTNHGTTVHLCHLCDVGFLTSVNLERHDQAMRHHTDDIIKCGACKRMFFTKNGFRTHLRSFHHEYPDRPPCWCGFCGKAFKHRSTLVAHWKTDHSGRVLRPLVCELCEEFFPSNEECQQHVLIYHGNELRHKKRIDLSDSGKPNPDSLSENYVDLVCRVCDKVFPDKGAFRRHVIAIHRMNDFRGRYNCSYCHVEMKNRHKFFSHMKRKHGETCDFTHLICDFCDDIFRTVSECKRHKRRYHGYSQIDCEDGAISVFSSSNTTDRNEQEHKQRILSLLASGNHRQLFEKVSDSEQNRTCSLCKKRFSSTRLFRRHINRKHLKESTSEQHQCPFCIKQCSLYQLSTHVQLCHGDKHIAPFVCVFCSEIFDNADSCTYHKKIFHRGIKPDLRFPSKHRVQTAKVKEPGTLDCGLEKNVEHFRQLPDLVQNTQVSKMSQRLCEKAEKSGGGHCRYSLAAALGAATVIEPIGSDDSLSSGTTGDVSQDLRSGAVRNIEESPAVCCSGCGRTFLSKYEFGFHAAREHVEEVENTRSVVCTICRTSFPDIMQIQNHMHSHVVNVRSCGSQDSDPGTHGAVGGVYLCNKPGRKQDVCTYGQQKKPPQDHTVTVNSCGFHGGLSGANQRHVAGRDQHWRSHGQGASLGVNTPPHGGARGEGATWYKCSTCDFYIGDRVNLSVHMRKVHGVGWAKLKDLV